MRRFGENFRKVSLPRVRSRIKRNSGQIWDTVLERKIQTLTECTAPNLSCPYTLSAAFSPDGKKIVTLMRDRNYGLFDEFDKTAQIWNTESGALLHTLVHPGETMSASFSPDGNKVVTESFTDNLWDTSDRWQIGHVWDAESGKIIKTLTAGYKGQEDAIFSPDERRFTFFKRRYENGRGAGTTESIVVSEFGTNKQPITLAERRSLGRGDSFWIDLVKFSPDGKKILTCSSIYKGREEKSTPTVRIWFLEP